MVSMVHPRLYDRVLTEHLRNHRQMALVSGPRQVGKTTTCRALGSTYLSWDNADHRRTIQRGPSEVARSAGLEQLSARTPCLVFDELHKHPRWKSFLKGFFDTYEDQVRILATGSSRLDVFRHGGDSLMGRYLLYRMHPFSVRECIDAKVPHDPVRPPRPIAEDDWQALLSHGGFPEPFLKRDARFTRRWRSLRHDQLVREDVREVAQVQDLGSLETLTLLLDERSAQQLVYSSLSQQIGVSVDTIRRWIDLLSRLHFGFLVRPWFRNVTKALRKEPKWYLRDWSSIHDAGARAETLVACHMLKAVEGWTDLGLGTFELRYLRDKAKREVDLLVVKDREPWLLAEVKTKETKLSEGLAHFQQQTRAPHALQVVMDLPFVDVSCFARSEPTVVPARTFLAQLL
jgi:predicted AAA+ superfamily ATPase